MEGMGCTRGGLEEWPAAGEVEQGGSSGRGDAALLLLLLLAMAMLNCCQRN
jgi:hypothetical protein